MAGYWPRSFLPFFIDLIEYTVFRSNSFRENNGKSKRHIYFQVDILDFMSQLFDIEKETVNNS